MRIVRNLFIILFLILPVTPAYSAELGSIIVGIDVSGSMRGDALDSTIGATQELIAKSGKSRDIKIYTFARSIQELNTGSDLSRLSSRGYTALYDAILELANRAALRSADLIVLTDGQDSRSKNSFEQLFSAISTLKLRIDFVAVRPLPIDLSKLQQIANSTGGKVISASQVSELVPALADSIKKGSIVAVGSGNKVLMAISGFSGMLSLAVLLIFRRWRRRERALDQWSSQLEDYELPNNEKSVSKIPAIPIKNALTRLIGDTTLVAPRILGRAKREFFLLLIALLLVGALNALGLPVIFAAFLTIAAVILTLRSLVKRAEWKARMAFESELPGALKLIASSLTAGLSFLQSVDTFSSESNTQVSREFRRALSEIQMGSPVERALGDVADRMASEDLRWVVFAFSVQREVGGSLAKILQTSAETIEARANLRQEVRTLSAEGRISSYILMLLPPGIFLFLALTRPNFVALFWKESIGHVLLVTVIVLISIAWIWMRRLIRVTV